MNWCTFYWSSKHVFKQINLGFLFSKVCYKIQVATILQALALHPWEGNDPRLTEYISYFDTVSIYIKRSLFQQSLLNFVETLVNSNLNSQTCLSSILEQVLSMDGLPTEQLSAVTSLFRRTVLLPENQLQPLFAWLKECLVLLERNGKLTDIEIWPSLVKLSAAVNDSITTLSSNGARTPPNPSMVPSGSSPNLSGSPSHRPSTLLPNGKGSFLGRKGTTL
jgi:hypothetical protein